MGKIVALLSGKGGSGKTSLALSMSCLLSDVGVKVLLVDCDFATNGATYFYEDKLTNNGSVPDFSSIFLEGEAETNNLLAISENASFIPSITRVSQETNAKIVLNSESRISRVRMMIKYFKDRYDVIIFDCQAGYSNVLELILPYTDVNLMVMEADAISASAIRSFYLKCGKLIEKNRVYQVINKATDEEFDIYSKISGGTLFVNVETVKFDWKIRNAFALAQIPELKTTGYRYGQQVYNICKSVLREDKVQERLKSFEKVISENMLKEKSDDLQKRIEEMKKERITNSSPLRNMSVMSFLLLMAITVSFLFYSIIETSLSRNTFVSIGNIGELLAMSLSIVALIASMLSTYALMKERKKKVEMIDTLYRELKDVDNELNDIKKEVS